MDTLRVTTPKSITSLHRTLLALALAAVSYLATTGELADVNDKASHVFAFFVLSLLVHGSWPAVKFGAGKMISLLGYGLLIEVVQHFLPRRSASLLDLAADGVGILLFLAVRAAVRRLVLLVHDARP